MPTLASLWLPIVVAAVFVFIASSLVHMLLRWHASDYRKLPNEDEVCAAIRKGNPVPGQYQFPHCAHGKDMQTAEAQQRFKDGPVGTLTIIASGVPSMGKYLAQWFAFTLLVAALTAGLSCTVLARGADLHQVFHFFAVSTLLTYGGGSVVNSIWMGRPWRSTGKDLLDALIYALVSAAAFAWLWPQ